MPRARKRTPPGGKSRKRPPPNDLMEQYSPYRVGNILATTPTQKPDTFESFVPKDGVCLNYDVSQTFLRLDAGNTKINIKETTATYVPIPPEMLEAMKKKPRRSKYGHGYPPQWIFINEIWLQEREALLELYRQQLAEFIKRRKQRDKLHGRSTHNRVQTMVGPDWYQELSPKQLKTADKLKSCIEKDLKDNTIINTQENIGTLGLVLRPNHRHIALALRLCCRCPVEFLLILYQLIDPFREAYSLNDRLLLSAVVHLTMTDTLKEMHVRIPSPPKPVKVPVPPPKKPKEKKYISPYLKPYNFKPTPRKYTGIYVNKHVQHPESPYFSYKESLNFERLITEDCLELDPENFDADEQEFIEEWQMAQTLYDKMQGEEIKIQLIRPKILVECVDFETYYTALIAEKEGEGEGGGDGGGRGFGGGFGFGFGIGGGGKGGRKGGKGRADEPEEEEIILPPLATLDDECERVCECDKLAEDLGLCCEHQLGQPCEECKRQCKKACDCRTRSMLYTSPKCTLCLENEYKRNTQKWIGGMATYDKKPIPIISGLVPPIVCDCLQDYRYKILSVAARNRIQCHKGAFVMGGVAVTPDGPVYIVSAALKKKRRKAMVPMILPKRVCKAAKEKSEDEDKCKSKAEKRERGPNECTCGLHSSDEESSEEEVASFKVGKGDGDSPEESICKKKEPEEEKEEEEKSICKREEESDVEEETTCVCKQSKKPRKAQDDEFEQPCECEDLCDCKEQSKRYMEDKCERCRAKLRLQYVERIIGGMRAIGSKDLVPVVEGTRLQVSCECLQQYTDKLLGIAARNRIKSQRSKFVILGVASTKEGPVYMLSTAIKKDRKRKEKPKEEEPTEELECLCKKQAKKKVSEDLFDDDPFKYSSCRCKEELEKVLAHKCTCEECQVEQRRKTATYIQGGLRYTESGNVVNVMEGVYSQRCNCLEKYLEKLSALEDYRRRIEARYRLRSQNIKYAIGGVVNTPDGPVYVITGLRPPVECECARVMQKQLEEQLHQRQMAKMPPTGRIKYQIAGVQQMSEENVFIVSQAMAIDDCSCMKLYNRFEEAHKRCLNTYDDFLKHVQEAVDEYTSEIGGEPEPPREEETGPHEELGEEEEREPPEEDAEAGKQPEEAGEVVQNVEPEPAPEPEAAEPKPEVVDEATAGIQTDEPETVIGGPLLECVFPSESESSTEEHTASTDSWDSSTVSIEPMQLKFTPSGKIDTSLSYTEEELAKYAKKEIIVDEDQEFKRFKIVKKIPCDAKEQRKIVQKILDSMAEDGFPLAKLPDCYKLPHFKLWMQMRCGKFWTQKDRVYYELFSKVHWCHTNICSREVARPQLGIDKAKAKLMTWRDAAFIRQIVSSKVGMYYRLVRQENIEEAREFFPLTFSYEFPTPTFRDCYFAYLPSKEEDVLVYRIVKPHEARVNLKKFPCY